MNILQRTSILCIVIFSFMTSLFGKVSPEIFREYDIRGIVGSEFLIEDDYELAASIATYWKEKDPNMQTVALGADGRVHSGKIKEKVIEALSSYGINIIDVGVCTTPVISFSLHVLPIDAALMLTASHNPGEYNGFKIYQGKESIFGEGIRRIKQIYDTKSFMEEASTKGIIQKKDLILEYIEDLAMRFPQLIGSSISAIIDCGNGAAGSILPRLIEKMQWSHVELLYGEIDGTFPHHVADPSVEKYMQDLKKALQSKEGVDVGIGLDGDCDRMGPMTPSGRLIKGDQLLVLLSKPLLEKYRGGCIVFDVSSSKFLWDVIRGWGGVPALSQTGAAAVKKKMGQMQALLGGEISCHTIFKDRHFGFDDGIYSMMRLFERVQESGHSLDILCEDLPLTASSPTYRIPCSRSLCEIIIQEVDELFHKEPMIERFREDGLRLHFQKGWAILRASNTEPVISIRLEGSTSEDLMQLKKTFHEILSRHIECSMLLD